MGKKLIITEKPSVARDFARVLNVTGNNNGYIENNEYVISWCFGHLVEMVYPESYDEKYKSWRLEDLPFLPETYKYGVIENSKDQYALVNRLLHRDDIDVVYWAGDSGKEGQTIEENIRIYGGVREGMEELRVWIDSQTDDEIRRGIREAKPMSEYELLGKSGIMRTIEDYALGINFSRALSVKYGKLINDAAATSSYTAIALGRVMTCVLGMVVNREREIRNFVETPFYRVVGNFSTNSFLAEWRAVGSSKYVDSYLLYKENGFKKIEDANALIDSFSGKKAIVDTVESTISKKKAPLLFNLAELQSECSKLFKISPSQTLDVIQELYEKKLTTYPRTDARVLTTAVAKEIAKNIKGLSSYTPVNDFVKDILENKKYVGIDKTSYTDDKKVTDHYAIIPTGQTGALNSLSPLHKCVYDLIVRRFLAIFYPPAEYRNIKVTVKIGDEPFFASAKVLTNPGYQVLAYNYQKEKDNKDSKDSSGSKENDDGNENEELGSKEELLKFVETAKSGDEIDVNGFEIKTGKTSPPKRYTSGNLILAMENAGNLIEDEELREQIKKSGIGTSATRGEILEKLVRIKYLNQNNKTQIISPENLGEMIYEVVRLSVPSLLNPEMTANWEMGLEGIINGTVDDKEYRRKLEDFIRKETEKMISSNLTPQIAANINPFTTKESKGLATIKPLGIVCPQCGGELTTTSFGYGCSNYRNEDIKCDFSVGTIAGVSLGEEDFKSLIETGKTAVLSGFVSKTKKSFKAALKMEKDENGKYAITFDFDSAPSEYIEGVICPDCGGRLYETGFGFACENRNSEEKPCRFGVGEIAGKKISLDLLKELLSGEETELINGFQTKNKVKFSSKLKMITDEAGKHQIVFATSYADGLLCPACGKKMIVTPFGFSCENRGNSDKSCYFSIGELAGRKLTLEEARLLFLEGRTGVLEGFKSKSKKPFKAALVLSEATDGHKAISFDFEDVAPDYLEGVNCPDCGGKIVIKSGFFTCENNIMNDPESCSFFVGKIAQKEIAKDNVEELLTIGKTSTIRGFKSKAGKRFDACLVLKKNENGKSEIAFDFEGVEAKPVKDVSCPVCGGPIVKTKFGYGCGNYNREEPDKGCRFNVGSIAGVKLNDSNLRDLLSNGVTSEIDGFKSKTGSKFSAKLCLDKDETGKVIGIKFLFEDDNVELKDLKCPKCSNPIIKNRFGYHCKNYSKDEGGCSFYVGRIAGLVLNDEQINELITNKKTQKIAGFTGKSGNAFEAALKFDENFNIVFDFE